MCRQTPTDTNTKRRSAEHLVSGAIKIKYYCLLCESYVVSKGIENLTTNPKAVVCAVGLKHFFLLFRPNQFM